MKWGLEYRQEARSFVAASARQRRRADQSRSLDVVLRKHRRRACPVVDTWWQTETGSILITPLPGITTLKPGSATKPFPGIEADIVDEEGKSVPLGGGGYIVLRRPWPSMLRGIYGQPQRYKEQYWSKFASPLSRRRRLQPRQRRLLLVHGPHRRRDERQRSPHLDDGSRKRARRPSGGGRSGRRRQERRSHRSSRRALRDTQRRLRGHAAARRGAAQTRRRPARQVHDARRHLTFTPELPKTRSGKIMRRLLRDIAEGRNLGDTTTLADSNVSPSFKRARLPRLSKDD